MSLEIDHVTIAGSDLATLEKAFSGVELGTDYGGPHSNGATHMALLGFDDGSYIELISTLGPGQPSPWWSKQIAGDGGPCAWAVRVDDIAAATARIAALGISAKGPARFNRARPDGVLVEWELTFLGEGEPGATLPFLIQDRTPREWRVRPSASVTGAELTGVAMVILGVRNLAASVDLFRRIYGWSVPRIEIDANWNARLAHFPNAPVILATALDENGWLSKRLAQFDESPCAFLIGTSKLGATARRLVLSEPVTLFDRRIAWFDPLKLNGVRLGVVGQGQGQ